MNSRINGFLWVFLLKGMVPKMIHIAVNLKGTMLVQKV